MENGNFPTSRDIYLEVNGRKLAVVEGYKAHSARESHYVEAFGSAEPVGLSLIHIWHKSIIRSQFN